ncbi:MAG: DoxX family membrane protein [Solirubrobacteraceae bacterium]|nr:DoxX family membrane protein [Solirubrobacteraceae bacterium]
MPTSIIHQATTLFGRADERMHTFAVRHAVSVLRVALAFVFILFGALKFFPDLSPAQEIATGVMTKLTFGLVPAHAALLAVAVAEVGVGVLLLANRAMRVAVWFLALEMVAILSPLVLFQGELFSGPHHLPSLIGQYILKDFVLLGGVLVLFATRRGAKIFDADTAEVEAAQLVESLAAVEPSGQPYGARGTRDLGDHVRRVRND